MVMRIERSPIFGKFTLEIKIKHPKQGEKWEALSTGPLETMVQMQRILELAIQELSVK